MPCSHIARSDPLRRMVNRHLIDYMIDYSRSQSISSISVVPLSSARLASTSASVPVSSRYNGSSMMPRFYCIVSLRMLCAVGLALCCLWLSRRLRGGGANASSRRLSGRACACFVFRAYKWGPGDRVIPGASRESVIAAARYSPTPCRVQYHRRAGS